MQEVNLLSDELRPRHDPFTLREFGMAWGLLVVLLALISSWQAYSNMAVNNETTAAKAELATLTQEITALTAAAKKQPDSLLVQQLAALTSERDEQRNLLQVLEQEHLNSGFVGHLRDLASIQMRKLWFDDIHLAKGGQEIRLAGYSQTAELVPLYLSMLAEGSAFSGYSFDGLKIKRESNVLVSFEVTGPKGDANE